MTPVWHEGVTGVTYLAGLPGPLDLVGSISPRPLLIVHGSDDEWIPLGQAQRLSSQAGQPCRYVEIAGANHAFSWHRRQLRDLVTG